MAREIPPRPNDEGGPSREEINKFIGHLEQRLIADSRGEFGANAESQPRRESAVAFYEKARAKAEAIIDSLDPDLGVSVGEVIVEPQDQSEQEYRTRVLKFSHRTRPELGWTMEIDEDDHYIQRQLEAVITRIYKRNLLK